jgi:hypothetical protein
VGAVRLAEAQRKDVNTKLRTPYTCLLVFSALSLAPALRADIYSTGFEPPTYSTGQLSGQDGWSASSTPVVENTTVFAGSQAVAYDSNGITGQDLATHGLTYDSVGNPYQTVVFDVEFMEGATGTSPDWDVLAAFGDVGFIAQLTVANGVAAFGPDIAGDTTGSVPITAGVWNDYQLVLNFQTDIASAYVDSTFIGSGAFASASTSLSGVDFGINSLTGGTDTATGYFDNLSVVAPEPSALILLLTTLLAVTFVARKRMVRSKSEPTQAND